MKKINSPLFNTIICYIFVVVLLLVIKPNIMYCDKKNKFKEFGFDDDKTLLSFSFLTLFSAILFYIIFVFIDIINKKLFI